jgi:hypothetical protein
MPNEIHSYNEFQHQIHEALRIQHPEWAEPNGECPTCESHEHRLAGLRGVSQPSTAVKMHRSSFLSYADD